MRRDGIIEEIYRAAREGTPVELADAAGQDSYRGPAPACRERPASEVTLAVPGSRGTGCSR